MGDVADRSEAATERLKQQGGLGEADTQAMLDKV